MKECRVCRTQNNDDVLFCHVCGTKFSMQEQDNTRSESSGMISTLSETEEQEQVTKPIQYEYLVLDSLNNEVVARHAIELNQSGPNYCLMFRQFATEFLNMLGRDGWKLIAHEPSFGNNMIFMRETTE